MAAAPATRAEILIEIRRLYQHLCALPKQDRPDGRRRASAAYRTIERQIRALADRHAAGEREGG